MSDVLHHYMVGDPVAPVKRGFDKHGQVHCLVWGMIYKKGKFFTPPNMYALGISGCGIGKVKSVAEGRKRLHGYIRCRLDSELKNVQDEVRRIKAALTQLGDDPANLERFRVEDERKQPPSCMKDKQPSQTTRIKEEDPNDGGGWK